MQPCDRLTAKEIQVAMLVWEGQTNREIRNVPLRAVRSEQANAIAGFYSQFHERHRQSRDAAQKFG